MTVILFILILSLLVLVHEFGHFIAAKKNGIRVEEFGLGLPPKIFAKQFGETLYSLNLLPFGGFVKLTGEDSLEEAGEEKNADGNLGQTVEIDSEEVTVTMEDSAGDTLVVEETTEVITETSLGTAESGGFGISPDPKSFSVKKPWQRFVVLVAGVFMNSVLAVSLFYVFFFFNGFKTFQLPLFFDYKFKFGQTEEMGTIVTDVQKDSGAAKAGIGLGEAILEINGNPVNNVKDVRAQLVGKQGQEVEVKLVDFKNQADLKTRIVKVSPSADEEGSPVLGVYLSKSVAINYNKPVDKLFAGFLHSYNVLGYSFTALAKIVGLSVETRDIAPVSQSVAGPVGIYNIIDAILKYGGARIWLTILDYIALMSLSLAAINILPFPALDGGRVFFVLWEWISGKRVNPVFEAKVHRIGMMFLLIFIVLITIKDVVL
jgi:regulator of sigma E protease